MVIGTKSKYGELVTKNVDVVGECCAREWWGAGAGENHDSSVAPKGTKMAIFLPNLKCIVYSV